jgi:hypothetical protein
VIRFRKHHDAAVVCCGFLRCCALGCLSYVIAFSQALLIIESLNKKRSGLYFYFAAYLSLPTPSATPKCRQHQFTATEMPYHRKCVKTQQNGNTKKYKDANRSPGSCSINGVRHCYVVHGICYNSNRESDCSPNEEDWR